MSLPVNGSTKPQMNNESEGLNAFGGVFTPSILTILGVIMYLRFGWVVGNVGVVGSLVIVSIATGITLLTGLSISQIATDQKVRVGGAYYMISRSLGIEAGGAIGIPLYFAQALSVALYTIGFAESLALVLPALNERLVAVITTVAVTALALASAKIAIRAQYFIMAAIAISLISFFTGGAAPPADLSTVPEKASFWVVFAVFFPAVTGIMAGVKMSGDLKDSRRAIPVGTLAAIGVSYVIYMIIPLVLNARADTASLLSDPLIMRQVSFWGGAILLGVWGATLSSAVGSILGAPRILQALARDRVLPKFLSVLGRGDGPSDEPRVGTLFTLVIALVAVILGDLNVIAPVLTMFFLTTYAVVNIVAGVERLLDSPSFRPTFRIPWALSMLGALGCIAVMILINWLATIIAIIIIAAIYVWLERRGLRVAWGDVKQGLWMAVTRTSLLKLRAEPDAKNWRPHMLVLSGAPTKRFHLIQFANALTHNRALLSVATIISDESMGFDRQKALEDSIRDYLVQRDVHAFLKVMKAPDQFVGAKRLVDVYGFGAFVPNTVVLGHSEQAKHQDSFADLLSYIYNARRNIIIVKANLEKNFGARQTIDLWWGGLKGNGGLMITLAYLLSTSLAWRRSKVRLKMMVASEEAAQDAEANLRALASEFRMPVDVQVFVAHGRTFEAVLHESSQDADLVLLGMKEPDTDYASYYQDLIRKTKGLPTTVLVRASETLEFGDILA